jgi:hypothetical protein
MLDPGRASGYIPSMISYGRKKFLLIVSRRIQSAILRNGRGLSDGVDGDI